MRTLAEQAGKIAKRLFETGWNYAGSMAAVCLFASVLGLGIYHAVIADSQLQYRCYAGLYNPAGAEVPVGLVHLGGSTQPGVPHVRMEYGSGNRMLRMHSVDEDGRICNLPGSKVAEQRLHYNEKGQLVQKENRAADGTRAEDAQGVAIRDFERDEAGRVVRTTFRNAAGERTVARFPGYAECRVQFDAQGRPLRIEHLDAGGRLLRNAEGEEVVVYQYGEDGTITRSNRVHGELADNHAGVAQEKCHTGATGCVRSWSNAAGALVIHPDVGAASLAHEASDNGHIERQLFMSADGSPRQYCRTSSEHLVRRNAAGQPDWECYSGSDGLPVNHPGLGYAERICQYAPDGKLEREYFWDAHGRPASTCERRYVDSPVGRYTLSLHADGATSLLPE